MLTTNLAPHLGLANGSWGIIRDIIPEAGVNPPNPPRTLVIEFDNRKGDSFILSSENELLYLLRSLTSFITW